MDLRQTVPAMGAVNGAPGETRTPNLLICRQELPDVLLCGFSPLSTPRLVQRRRAMITDRTQLIHSFITGNRLHAHTTQPGSTVRAL
ncbi:Uncharacterised protein [Mycobacteroides abscessus subsp. massiliense]|nr:Uncharacterised protein [Mycobacteroides abscessus subsp. massiliense]SKU13810.1 Uncharacterised protein [Mycobacteroides abscessus subsp. massiliense]